MVYVSAASTISHQPTFKNAGFSNTIKPLVAGSGLQSPNYKDYIEGGLLRRMSKILRMSVACAKDCLEQAGILQPDSIVVGTGLGCLQDTEKFLNTFLTVEGLLPPTSFIQSTHNTIAGQISLSIGNHGYNMTHTQNTLSFEHALQDALLLLGEDNNHVLVGGADEHVEILDEIGRNLGLSENASLTSGASFFMLSNEKNDNVIAQIVDVETTGFVNDIPARIESFLSRNEFTAVELDEIFFSGFSNEDVMGIPLHSYFDGNNENRKILNYTPFSGLYATNSAFALHLAIDKMQQNRQMKNVLICNNLNKINLGLTLVQSIEA